MAEDKDENIPRDIREYAHKAATQSVLSTQASQQAQEQAKIMREAGPYLTLGIQMILTIGIFFGIGYWLDHHFNTTPLWIAIFTAFGSVASLVYFIVTVIQLGKKSEGKK